ncbi:MAG: hypothetical protein ABI114_12285 [Rhodanobacter sp.]
MKPQACACASELGAKAIRGLGMVTAAQDCLAGASRAGVATLWLIYSGISLLVKSVDDIFVRGRLYRSRMWVIQSANITQQLSRSESDSERPSKFAMLAVRPFFSRIASIVQ